MRKFPPVGISRDCFSKCTNLYNKVLKSTMKNLGVFLYSNFTESELVVSMFESLCMCVNIGIKSDGRII